MVIDGQLQSPPHQHHDRLRTTFFISSQYVTAIFHLLCMNGIYLPTHEDVLLSFSSHLDHSYHHSMNSSSSPPYLPWILIQLMRLHDTNIDSPYAPTYLLTYDGIHSCCPYTISVFKLITRACNEDTISSSIALIRQTIAEKVAARFSSI